MTFPIKYSEEEGKHFKVVVTNVFEYLYIYFFVYVPNQFYIIKG